MVLAHLGDVLMGGADGTSLEIIVPPDKKRSLGEMRCRLVLIGLSYHANKDSYAWPSARTLGEELNMPESKVRVALEVLEENGWIKKVSGYKPGSHGTKYQLTLPSFSDPNEEVEASGTHLITQIQPHENLPIPPEYVLQISTQVGTPACDKEEEKEEDLNKYKFEQLTHALVQKKVSKRDSDFQKFWSAYPKKVDPGRTQNMWNVAITKAPIDMIIAAAERYAFEVEVADTDEQYIAHPSNWLFQERWTDEDED